MDAFYASIEIRDQPELKGLPVIVGGVSGRGVVCAASYEARKFGVRSAMPTFQARRLCPDGVFLRPNMGKYARVSEQIHSVFLEFTSEIEPIALDEAYLDVTGSFSLYSEPLLLAQRLKRRVYEATQLVVSVGVGPNKLIAKIACTLGKPDGLRIVTEQGAAPLLEPLPVRRLWGIGPVAQTELERRGILTIGDLRRAPAEILRETFGTRSDEITQMAWGRDERPVESNREARSIGEESTFETDVRAPDVITAAITAHCEAVAHRLRKLGMRAHTIILKVKLARAQGTFLDRNSGDGGAPRYPLVTRSKTLPQAIQDGTQMRAVVLALWQQAQVTVPLRLLGVSVSQFEPSNDAQLELFSGGRKPDRLGKAIDAIQERYGQGAIRRAVDAPAKLTPSKQAKRGETLKRR
jgi:DNA polymerase IV